MTLPLPDLIRTIISHYPQVRAGLSPRARWLAASKISAPVKTFEFFVNQVEHLVRSVYGGYLGGEFVDILANIVAGQFTQAYNRALLEEGLSMDEEFRAHLDSYITDGTNFDFIYGYYTDIIDARVDETPVEPLIARAALWANRYNEVYNGAKAEIARRFGGKLVWRLGATEEHCGTCAALDGLVAFATEWDTAGFHPQGAPNALLECGGWRCDCSLTITDKRRSPNALDRLLTIGVSGR